MVERHRGASADRREVPVKGPLGVSEVEIMAGMVRDLTSRSRCLLVVRGSSMRPTLSDGDKVVIERLPRAGATAGDMVLFERVGCLCLHRVIAVIGDGDVPCGYVTAGDGLLFPDGEVPHAAVLGRVVRVDARNGRWSPSSPGRRLQAFARVGLGRHPRLRSGLRVLRAPFRRPLSDDQGVGR